MVYFDAPHAFTGGELELSQNIARQLAFGVERKRAQQALVESRERFDFVGEASDLGFWFCDLPFDKLVWDHRVKEHFSLPPDADVTIQMFYQRLHSEDRERTRRAIDEAITNNSRYDIEYRTLAEGGAEKWIRAIGRVYRNESGKPIRFDGVTLDITKKKLAEQALVASEERLRRLAENLDIEVRARTRELEQRNTDVIRQSEMLRDLSKRMMQMQDEERRHIARELHDSAGQTLTVLGMRLAELVQESQVNAPGIAKHVEETQELVQQLNREIRTTSYLLHPPLLDETGLGPALKWYLEGLKGRSTIEITLEVDDDFGRLPRDMELVVFRLVQECLTNIHRHSGSKVANVSLTRDINSVSLEVRDQGVGIPQEKLAQLQSQGSGVGIRGMRERVRQFRGDMSIESDGSGTSVLVTLPVLGNLPPNEELSHLRAVV
jgi:PAS domain S-box-containing protein